VLIFETAVGQHVSGEHQQCFRSQLLGGVDGRRQILEHAFATAEKAIAVPSRDRTGDEATPARLVICRSSIGGGCVEQDANKQTGKIRPQTCITFYRRLWHGGLYV
jgi:hypothetical protein